MVEPFQLPRGILFLLEKLLRKIGDPSESHAEKGRQRDRLTKERYFPQVFCESFFWTYVCEECHMKYLLHTRYYF